MTPNDEEILRLHKLRYKLEARRNIEKTETGKHLAAIYYELTFYERYKQQTTQIHKTLITNYVNKCTDGIQVTLTNETSTHELLMQVLQAYSQQLNKLSPVKDAQ